MEPKLYVVVDEYEGGYVGTDEQIIDWHDSVDAHTETSTP